MARMVWKESKKFFGSFNQSTKKAKTKLKKPFLETGRKLDTIEKTFLGRAKEIWELVDSEFKPYLDEKERLKKESEERKNKAQIDKINELSEQTVEQNLVIERAKIYKKYNDANQDILNDILEKTENYSEASLQIELRTLKQSTFDIPDEDRNILLDDQIFNLKESYESIIRSSVRMIEMRIKEMKEDKPMSTPEAPTVDFIAPSTQEPITFAKAFMEIMKEATDKIELLPTTTEREKQAQQSSIGGLQGYTLKILNYLEPDGDW